jgi:hypothetical protein
MTGRLVVGAILAVSCGDPTRLPEPPAPSPSCVPDWEVCEFAEQCCSYARCSANRCEPIDELVVPDAGCSPAQVDIAIVIDLSDSMDPYIDDTVDALVDALPHIPPTTTVQVWVTPPSHLEDGTYRQLTPRASPAEAAWAIAGLHEGEGGLEATLDVTGHLLRDYGLWRFGTTVRAIFVISDERPGSYKSPRTTMSDICDLTRPDDRLVAFTRREVFEAWEECYETRTISSLWALPALLADPCEVGP